MTSGHGRSDTQERLEDAVVDYNRLVTSMLDYIEALMEERDQWKARALEAESQ